jgi:hypothetical protein
MGTRPSLLLIAAATLLSEDLTPDGVGLAVRTGAAPLWPSLAACVVGIYAGDVGLWHSDMMADAECWLGALPARWMLLAVAVWTPLLLPAPWRWAREWRARSWPSWLLNAPVVLWVALSAVHDGRARLAPSDRGQAGHR